MSPTLDPGRLRDPALRPIAGKVLEGARLSPADARILYATSDLIGLGRLADMANQRRNGDRVFFSANQHINPTNVCVLRNTCTFCSFARMPKEDGRVHPLARGGLRRGRAGARHADPRVPHRRRAAPQAPAQLLHRHDPGPQGAPPRRCTSRRSPRSRSPTSRGSRRSPSARCSSRMKEAGLTSLPGGGAEVFSTAVRATIAERKLTGQEWLRVHRVAHELGIPTNCTMLYGHVETAEDRIEHLGMLRELQDETGGFLTYIPLAYHPDHNELGEELGRVGTATTGYEDLKNIAVGRLFLDNIPHVKTHWPMVTPFLSQIALALRLRRRRGHRGVRADLSRGRRAHRTCTCPTIELVRADPRRGEAPGGARQPLPAGARALRRAAAGRRSARRQRLQRCMPRGARRMRLGRIPWINCYPVYGAIDRGLVPVPADAA